MSGKPMAIRGRLGTLLASIALAASLAPTVALAAPTSPTDVADSKVTITDLENGDVVSAYQIADTDIDAANGLSYKMASNLPADFDTIDKFGALASDGTTFVQNSEIQKAASAVAKSFADANVAAVTTATAANNSAELTLGSGYYLIRVTTASGTARVYQNMIIDVTPVVGANGKYASHADQSLPVKKTDVGITKTVKDEQAKTTDGYGVGDSVPFTVKTAIPSYPADSKSATFKITDTPTKGLEIDPATIKINGAPAQSGADYTITAAATGYTIEFKKEYVLKNAGLSITVTYNAKVTSDAFSMEDGSVTGNTAKLTFNPNPYEDGTAEPSDKTDVRTYGLVFKKVDGAGNVLPGAVFTLKLTNGQELTSTSDGEGYVYFSGLAAGSYTVIETGVPAGYQKAPDQAFELDAAGCTKDNPATKDVKENNYYVAATDVIDPSQAALPAAGGPGTLAITAAGVILLAVGGFVLVRTQGKKNVE